MGCQYWKNNKSILPAVQEDGIVGLTFSPSGEHFGLLFFGVCRALEM
jgi:hypothetical protein